MAARNYSSVARATTLTAGVSGGATAMAVTETTGFPAVPFTLVVDPGRSGEEVVTVTNQIGLNLTVLRGQDGTAAQPHDAGATLRHMATARDFREAADHVALTEGVHGLVGGVAGVNDDQDLDNKTFLAGLTDHTAVTVRAAPGQTTPILRFSDTSDVTTAYVNTSGRLNTPGVDGMSSSLFTAGAAGTIPLTVKGFPAQSAKLLSLKDSANLEVSSLGVDGSGAFSGPVTASSVTTGTAALGTVNGTVSATFTSASGVTPLVALQPSGQTARSFAVRDSLGVDRTGVANESGQFQLFQGETTNKVPFRMHVGSVFPTIQGGTTSVGESVDLTPYNFQVKPAIFVNVVQGEETATKRRVSANTYNESATGFSIRTFQTEGENLPDDTNYSVRWLAIQFNPNSALG